MRPFVDRGNKQNNSVGVDMNVCSELQYQYRACGLDGQCIMQATMQVCKHMPDQDKVSMISLHKGIM